MTSVARDKEGHVSGTGRSWSFCCVLHSAKRAPHVRNSSSGIWGEPQNNTRQTRTVHAIIYQRIAKFHIRQSLPSAQLGKLDKGCNKWSTLGRCGIAYFRTWQSFSECRAQWSRQRLVHMSCPCLLWHGTTVNVSFRFPSVFAKFLLHDTWQIFYVFLECPWEKLHKVNSVQSRPAEPCLPGVSLGKCFDEFFFLFPLSDFGTRQS